MNTIVHIDQLYKSYPGGVMALNGLNLAVRAACVFALLGPNGAGKSTTLRALATLTQPDNGAVTVAGLNALSKGVAVRRKIGYVPQTRCSDPYASVEKNLYFQATLYGLFSTAARARVKVLLHQFQLDECRNRLASQLSGGLRRRLEIAMGMVHSPTLLLLDEPNNGLDPDARAKLWELLTAAARDDGTTLVFSTHHLDEADLHAHEVAIIDGGRVLAQDTPAALKRQLHTTIFTFEFKQPETATRAARVLTQQPGPSKVVTLGSTLRISSENEHDFLAELLRIFEQHDFTIEHYIASRATLGDVYTMLTSKNFV